MIKESIIYLLNTAIRTVKPCKIRFGHEEYQKGWNDCIKELNKRQKKYVFEFNEDLSAKYRVEDRIIHYANGSTIKFLKIVPLSKSQKKPIKKDNL